MFGIDVFFIKGELFTGYGCRGVYFQTDIQVLLQCAPLAFVWNKFSGFKSQGLAIGAGYADVAVKQAPQSPVAPGQVFMKLMEILFTCIKILYSTDTPVSEICAGEALLEGKKKIFPCSSYAHSVGLPAGYRI